MFFAKVLKFCDELGVWKLATNVKFQHISKITPARPSLSTRLPNNINIYPSLKVLYAHTRTCVLP